MDRIFQQYVEQLNPSFERLLSMEPVSISRLPIGGLPKQGIYLFNEKGKWMYVGRSNNLRNRFRQHSIDGAQHNQAVFAFKLAREMTGMTKVSYQPAGSRKSLVELPEFADAFLQAKRRVRTMDLRYVEETDQLRQALLEIYVAVALKTPYNDFETH